MSVGRRMFAIGALKRERVGRVAVECDRTASEHFDIERKARKSERLRHALHIGRCSVRIDSRDSRQCIADDAAGLAHQLGIARHCCCIGECSVVENFANQCVLRDPRVLLRRQLCTECVQTVAARAEHRRRHTLPNCRDRVCLACYHTRACGVRPRANSRLVDTETADQCRAKRYVATCRDSLSIDRQLRRHLHAAGAEGNGQRVAVE